MSGILRRTVFYEFDQRNNQANVYKFHDWNQVVTGLGTMFEPSQMVPRPINGNQLDWEDSGIKIDIMTNINADKTKAASGGTIGNNLQPRKGR